jgi:membrane protein DedA with SNARE-associated domain
MLNGTANQLLKLDNVPAKFHKPRRYEAQMAVGVTSQAKRFRNLLIALIVIFPVAFTVTSYLEDIMESSGQEGSRAIINLITGLPTRLINLASGAGYSGIFLLMLLESAAFPVPSEIILPLAGYLVFLGVLQYWMVIFCSTTAALVGSFVDYYLGRRLGEPLVTGKTKLPYVEPALLQKAQAWFSAHGAEAVALLRLVPTARVLISFPAGACRMSPKKFVFYTLLGCVPWNMGLVFLGWWLGASWGSVVSSFRYINLLVYLSIITLFFWTIHRLTRGRRD